MYQTDDVKKVVARIEQRICMEKDYLGELDGKSGDGDLGLSMEAAFHAVREATENDTEGRMDEMLRRAAMSCNKAAPSTMGTLLSSGIMAIAKMCRGKDGVEDADVVKMPRCFADAIAARGGAKLGDKTILDALYPMADCVEESFAAGALLKDAFAAGAQRAKEAAVGTAGMHAATGRAKWLGERAAAYPDGGAVLCGIIADAVVQDA